VLGLGDGWLDVHPSRTFDRLEAVSAARSRSAVTVTSASYGYVAARTLTGAI